MECSLKHQSALLVTKNGVVEKLMVLILTVIAIYSLLKFFRYFALLSKATRLQGASAKA